MQGPAEPSNDPRRLREELSRLRLKLEHSTDRDIRAVLQMRIEQIESELPPEALAAPVPAPVEEAAEAEVAEEVPAATKEQLDEADRLIRQARVEKMRGNASESTKLLKQAAEAAPGSIAVLESLGDDLMERKQLKAAMDAYKKAFRLDPKNVGVEEKLAKAALLMDSLGSIDDQMKRNLSDSPFLTEGESLARLPVAVMLSAIVPGSGHLVLGKTQTGLTILTLWIAASIWFLMHWFDFVKLLSLASGGHEKPDMIVLGPMIIMVLIYLSTLGSLKGMSGKVVRKPVERPRPPVDLPFE